MKKKSRAVLRGLLILLGIVCAIVLTIKIIAYSLRRDICEEFGVSKNVFQSAECLRGYEDYAYGWGDGVSFYVYRLAGEQNCALQEQVHNAQGWERLPLNEFMGMNIERICEKAKYSYDKVEELLIHQEGYWRRINPSSLDSMSYQFMAFIPSEKIVFYFVENF